MHRINAILFKQTSIAPLVSFRIVIGFLLFYSNYRMFEKGWIKENYIDPVFHFSFLKNIQPLEGNGMCVVFFFLGITSLTIASGALYKLSVAIHLSLFSYVELIDKTFYLNHYYLVTLLLFWMLWVPANKWFSIDTLLFPKIKSQTCKNWHVIIFKIQLSIVYFFAGVAKINDDWLLRAQPLATWLPGKYQIPIIGSFLHLKSVAYLFSWFGCIYDTTIWLFLWLKKTRTIAYLFVIIFHVLTGVLFPRIGMFPYIMICSTIIFFSSDFHIQLLNFIGAKLEHVQEEENHIQPNFIIKYFLGLYLLIQLYLPIRHIQYPGDLFWNEQGYRFSWRVMLIEKNGFTSFILKDPKTNISKEIDQDNYLTPFQKQQMRSQPDMILQFSKHIGDEFLVQNGYKPKIYVKSRLSLNGRRSQVFTDDRMDVYSTKSPIVNGWIIPMKSN